MLGKDVNALQVAPLHLEASYRSLKALYLPRGVTLGQTNSDRVGGARL